MRQYSGMNGEPPCWTSCSDGTEGKLGDTAWEQPALFALECALTALWSSVGIRPGVVMGHSVGELAAAHTAGVFSLEDGMRFACARGALLSATEPGAMAAVFAPAPQVAAEVQAANTLSAGIGVNISADNGTHQVISGPVDEVETIMKRLESEGIRARRLNTAKAFHSALVEPALDALETSLDGVKTEPPSLAVVSNLTGRVVKSGQALDGTYWRRHAREPVAFARGVGTLAELGVDLVLEIGPHAVLAPMALSAWPESAQTPVPMVLSSLQRPSGNGAAPAGGSFTEAAAAAYEAGLPVRFAGLFAGESRRRISIPGYPFQRRRHWVETAKQRRGSADHPLLGERHESARGEITFETELFRSDPEWLNDHRVFNRVVAPGALYGAMAASAMLCEGDWPVVVEDMQLHNPLVFPEESAQEDEAGKDEDKDSRKLQVVLDASEQAPSRPVQIFSKGNEEGWTVHVEGRVSADAPVPEAAGRIDAESLKSVLSPVDVAGYYRARAGTGVDLGPSFRTLGKAWSRQGEALGEVSFPAALGSSGTDIHPLLLDGCFQVVGIARGLTGTQSTTTYLPFGWERLWLTQKLPEQALCHVRMNQVSQEQDTGEPPEVLSGELRIYDANGVLIGGINGYTVKRATRAALLSAVEGVKDLLYEIVWRERALPPGMKAADFFPGPATVAAEAQLFTDYLTEAGVPPESRDALLQDLERWSRRRALATLEELGWQRVAGETVDPEALQQQLNVIEEHRRLFRRMFEMLARSGVVAETDAGFTVLLGPEDPLPVRALEPREVRVAVDAAGLNFWEVFRSLGFIEEGLLGREMCGYILETGAGVSTVSAGDHIVGLGFGAFGPQMVTHEELVTPAPKGFSVSELATVPIAFVSAALSFEFSGLKAGDRVLVHAGAGGVGLAAIQLVQAAGAEVFATASMPKQAYLRSLGVKHIFDSRTTAFGQEILAATDGEGVDVVLNSLTGEGFIDTSLSCLRQGGRFVEMARRDILSEDEMAALRPDVPYHILELDVLKKTEPARVGKVLRGIIERLSSGELKPIIHSRWPLAEAGAALSFMRSARHLGKVVVTTPPLVKDRLRQDRTYLVTGGLGGIGCAIAGWLADHGAGTIVLNGRRDPDAAAQEVIEALKDRGVRVQVELAEMTDMAAVDGMLARVNRELPPLGGVIHSVGVLSDGALTNQSWDRFEEVLWPKILGGWHLHRATADRDLDFFILFSSRVGVMGNPGQANHAAANAFLDQLAGHRRALGLPGQAIAWGAWSDIGEAAEQRDRIDRQRSALGGRWFTPQQGIRALDRLVRQDATTAVVMSMDWSVFEEAVEERPPLLEDLLSTGSDDKAKSAASPDDLLTSLREAPATVHEELLVSFLQQEVQAVLRLQSAPEPKVGFFDLGMDSLRAVELRNRLNRAFSGEYTASNTVVFDYPDISTLAGHLVGELGEAIDMPAAPAQPWPQPEPQPETQPGAQIATGPGPSPGSGDDGIAIIGMACRFPGAPDLQSFWRLLEAGVDAVTDGRRAPGSWEGVTGDPAQSDSALRRAGFIEGIDLFDARFFGISPIIARATDPQHRLLLETSWHALEDAGINPDDLRGSNTGVFAGVASSEYRDLMLAAGSSISYVGTANSMAVGGVSFKLGLTSPAVPVELNCASSLVSVHHALTALRQGEVNLALAGGVNTVLSPGKTREMAELGMLSKEQRCKTFDASADGFARGEGCGMLVLKRLSEAQADGDHIRAVVAARRSTRTGRAPDRRRRTARGRNGSSKRHWRKPALSRHKWTTWKPMAPGRPLATRSRCRRRHRLMGTGGRRIARC